MYERAHETLQGLGFSDVVGHPTCPDYPGYQQRCFTTVEVNGQPAEQEFARAQGCVLQGGPCTTSPGGNQGNIWCCAPGWPRPPGSAPLQPGEVPPTPPPPPGIQRVIREWWFWGLIGGVGVAAFFGWKMWQHAHNAPADEHGYEGFDKQAALKRLKADRQAIRDEIDRSGLGD